MKRFSIELGEANGLRAEDLLTPAEWYIAQIELERDLQGEPQTRNRWLAPRWSLQDTNLQDQLDRERTGVYLGQGLFVVVVSFLIAAVL